MILYNPPLADTETDNHFLPAVHLADGTALPGLHGRPPDGDGHVHRRRQGRRPGRRDGLVLLARPGRLTSSSPTSPRPACRSSPATRRRPTRSPSGPAGQYYQAIAGTSMSSPHIAGSAILLQGPAPDVGSRRDQVGADDHGERPTSSRRTAPRRPIRSTTVPVASTSPRPARRRSCSRTPPRTWPSSATTRCTAMNVNIPSINVPTMPGSVDRRPGRPPTCRRRPTLRGHRPTHPTGRRSRSRRSPARSRPARPRRSRSRSRRTPRGPVLRSDQLQLGRATRTCTCRWRSSTSRVTSTVTQTCDPPTVQLQGATRCTVTATNNSFDDGGGRRARRR